jgi:thiol-disulfide isomerase/thioredoxin
MKKTALILAIVIVLVAVVFYVDKKTRLQTGVTSASESGAEMAAAGKPAPDFSVKNLDGKDVTLADYKGKVVLVNFWATWCDPCRIEIPWLIEMQNKYGPRGFTVLGVAMDDEGKSVVAPFIEKERFDVGGQKLPMNYPIVLGNDNVADKFGGLLGYPTSVLISPDGKIVKRITGIISEDEITRQIEDLLPKSTSRS